MDATKLLERQHRDIESLFARHRHLTTQRAKLLSFEAIAARLTAQLAVEEELFYPLAFVGDLADVLNDSLEQHQLVKSLIRDLGSQREAGPAFDERMRLLELLVGHHVGEEESTVFPQIRDVQTPEALDALGRRMERMLRRRCDRHDAPDRRLP